MQSSIFNRWSHRKRKSTHPFIHTSNVLRHLEVLKLPLSSILRRPVFRIYFNQHLESKYCEENLKFLEGVANLRNSENINDSARKIFDEFIDLDGPTPVNIPCNVYAKLYQHFTAAIPLPANHQLFSPAVYEITRLLESELHDFFRTTKYAMLVETLSVEEREELKSEEIKQLKQRNVLIESPTISHTSTTSVYPVTTNLSSSSTQRSDTNTSRLEDGLSTSSPSSQILKYHDTETSISRSESEFESPIPLRFHNFTEDSPTISPRSH